jgi:UDP-glucose 4-epimerase
MKAFITGGSGFVGSHLADRLLARGDRVLVIDNFETGRRDNLRARDGLEVVEGTISDGALVRSLVGDFRPDLVVHAAASYKDPENWEGDVTTNALGTAIVAQAAKAAGCERLIYFQTALCYGTNPTEQPVTLGHHLDPDSSYAISKTAGELYLRLSGLDWVSFRLANAYGPRNISGPLPTFFSRLTDAKPCFVMDTRRDFVFINDMIDAVVMAVDGSGHGTYHLSSGGDVSIKELFDATVGAMGIRLDEPVEVRPRGTDDSFTILLDPSRTRADFEGWTPETPLAAGVAAAIAYYREYGIDQTYTHLHLPSEDEH